MKPSTRNRLVLPILLPIGILGGIALILWGFSRILLGIHGSAATVVAIVVATSIMVVSAIAVSRPQVRASTIAAVLGTTAGVAMLAGGIAIAVVAGEEEPGGGEPPGGAVVDLVAQNIAFSPANLSVPAGQPFTIAFDNRDPATQHNVEIFDNQELSGTPLFSGDLVTGPGKATYDVGPLDAGTYYFRCVVHPNMTGQIVAAGGGGDGDGGGGGITVAAQNLAFDTDRIELPPDAPATITFDNRDAGTQHNISIYSDSSLGEQLFQGELVTGPATAEYAIPPLPAGEYYFQCDVHPTMNGAVVDGPGGGATGPGATGATGPSGRR